MKPFLNEEGASDMKTQLESQAGLQRATDAAYWKLTKMNKDCSLWPLPQERGFTTNKPFDHKNPEFAMQSKSGYVFLRAQLDKDYCDMIVDRKAKSTSNSNVVPGKEVKEHVKAQLEKQNDPYDVVYHMIGDEQALEKSMTLKKRRDAEKASHMR